MTVKQYEEIEDCYPFGEYHHVVMKKDNEQEGLVNYLNQQGFGSFEMKPVRPDIEDCFMALMKK